MHNLRILLDLQHGWTLAVGTLRYVNTIHGGLWNTLARGENIPVGWEQLVVRGHSSMPLQDSIHTIQRRRGRNRRMLYAAREDLVL